MTKLKVQVKPTAGGEKFSVEVEDDIIISELKEEVAKHSTIPAPEQRLIYKGQILKDERTVGSYGNPWVEAVNFFYIN
jgi:ubiquilin